MNSYLKQFIILHVINQLNYQNNMDHINLFKDQNNNNVFYNLTCGIKIQNIMIGQLLNKKYKNME